jgi:hypothetical protein
MATGVGNRRAAGELAFRFLVDSFTWFKGGRTTRAARLARR